MAKAHIVPDAFMRRISAAPFMELDGISRPRKAYSGWYDREIVSDCGEKILAKLDDIAGKCFIEGGWTYRARRDPLNPAKLLKALPPNSLITMERVDSAKLRLFGLSLLWRSVVSRRSAFVDVKVDPRVLEELRIRIVRDNPGSHLEFPVYFGIFCSGVELPKMAPVKVMLDVDPFKVETSLREALCRS